MVVDLLRRSHLLQDAVLHHGDPIAHGHRLDLVMGDVDRGGAEPLLHTLEVNPKLGPELGVDARQRLVEEVDMRVLDDGSAQRDALLLAA